MKRTAQQLAALGISGGGSESANLSLAANYENNLASNEQARQQALRDYALQALLARTQADSDISGYYADAKQQAMNAWQSEAANRNSWNQWAAGYGQQLREYGDSLNSQTYQEILASNAICGHTAAASRLTLRCRWATTRSWRQWAMTLAI